MINSPLRLAALAAAAVTVLAFPAAARSDAAFAASLGRPLTGLATIAQLKTRSQVPPAARPQGPVAPVGAWNSVLAIAINEGKLEFDPKSKFHTFMVKDAFNHPDGTHYILRIFLLAIKNGDGSFRAHAVQLSVHEIRALPGGAVGSGHWFFDVSGAGRLEKVVSAKSVTRGTVTETGPSVPMDLAAAETKERFDEAVAYWHESLQR